MAPKKQPKKEGLAPEEGLERGEHGRERRRLERERTISQIDPVANRARDAQGNLMPNASTEMLAPLLSGLPEEVRENRRFLSTPLRNLPVFSKSSLSMLLVLMSCRIGVERQLSAIQIRRG